MAVKIRLRRMGQIHKKWLQNGAQPTETVARLLKKFNI